MQNTCCFTRTSIPTRDKSPNLSNYFSFRKKIRDIKSREDSTNCPILYKLPPQKLIGLFKFINILICCKISSRTNSITLSDHDKLV